MRLRYRRRLILATVLVIAVAAGIAMSWIKGSGGGTRLALGNLSAPWLLIPLLAGATYAARPDRGAIIGALATVAALLGFYGQQSPLADLSRSSLRFLAHPELVFDFVVRAHLPYFVLGVITGAVFGTCGTLGTRRGSLVAVLAAALLICEPFAWILWQTWTKGTLSEPWELWGGEIAAGFALAVTTAHRRQTARSASLIRQ